LAVGVGVLGASISEACSGMPKAKEIASDQSLHVLEDRALSACVLALVTQLAE
jgi:hypothetical protein